MLTWLFFLNFTHSWSSLIHPTLKAKHVISCVIVCSVISVARLAELPIETQERDELPGRRLETARQMIQNYWLVETGNWLDLRVVAVSLKSFFSFLFFLFCCFCWQFHGNVNISHWKTIRYSSGLSGWLSKANFPSNHSQPAVFRTELKRREVILISYK